MKIGDLVRVKFDCPLHPDDPDLLDNSAPASTRGLSGEIVDHFADRDEFQVNFKNDYWFYREDQLELL